MLCWMLIDKRQVSRKTITMAALPPNTDNWLVGQIDGIALIALRSNTLDCVGLLRTTRREFVLQFHSLSHLPFADVRGRPESSRHVFRIVECLLMTQSGHPVTRRFGCYADIPLRYSDRQS